MRFTRTDEPERALTYMGDQEDFDAIVFTPKRNIAFAGFSIYPAIVPFQNKNEYLDDVQCIYSYKINGVKGPEGVKNFGNADIKNKMVDIVFEHAIPVQANQPICIMVRYVGSELGFMTTLLGYGGSSMRSIPGNEKDLFTTQNTVIIIIAILR